MNYPLAVSQVMFIARIQQESEMLKVESDIYMPMRIYNMKANIAHYGTQWTPQWFEAGGGMQICCVFGYRHGSYVLQELPAR